MKTGRSKEELLMELVEHFQAECAAAKASEASTKEELAALREGFSALREENAAMRQSHKQELEAQKEEHHREMEAQREYYDKKFAELKASHKQELEQVQTTLEKAMMKVTEANIDLAKQLKNAFSSGNIARAKKYGRSSEQRNLLNNRKTNNRKQEEDDSDGSAPLSTSSDPADSTGSDEATDTADSEYKQQSKKTRKKDVPDGKMHFDVVIDHPLTETLELPEGARLLPETNWYEIIRYIPARTECHRYEYGRYILTKEEDPDVFDSTLPQEIREQRPIDGCPLSTELLAFIMTQKYAYHQPQRRIRAMLRDLGVYIPKQTLNRYFLLGADELLKMIGETFSREAHNGDYFMVDETVITVGVDKKDLRRQYLNRYMWEFYNRSQNLVEYVYEHGSRSQQVLKSFFGDGTSLPGFIISCDGYNAYHLFDNNEQYPDVTVVGCWTHARRNFIDALATCPKPCKEVLDMIDFLFEAEQECKSKGLKGEERLKYRKRISKPILETLKAMIERMWNDTGLMAVSLLKKAVGYVRNQWGHLFNILKTGIAEISNNLAEQRIRPIKLSLKNCMNIGSENAAIRHAFMFSLAESCRINSVNMLDYFTCLFSKTRLKLSPDELTGLLPNHIPLKC